MNDTTINEGLGDIAAALAKAQLAMSNPAFDSQNPHFKNRFASLAAVRNAVVPVLAKHGICLTQDLRTTENAVSCTTILTHESGQQMQFGPYTLPVSKADAQGYGSASTYARRYHLMAVAGVVGDSDDDAETAVGRTSNGDAAPGYPPEVLTPEKRTVLLPKVAAAIDSKNGPALKKLVDSMNEGEQKGVWSFLNMKQKAAARELLQKADAPASKAAEYAERIRKALDLGVDERISELHAEINLVPEFALEVSTILTTGELDRVNAAVDRLR